MTINLNQSARFRLTERGREIFVQFHDGIPPKVDADGWTRIQLWEAFRIFGPHLGVFRFQPFEMTIEVLDD